MSHYFDQDPTTLSSPFTIDVTFKGQNYLFTSDHGVFSKNHFDYASKLLCETIPLQDGNTVCDLGCGIGIMGFLLEENYAIDLTMVDINARAIECAIKNKQSLSSKATVIQNDGLKGLDQNFDVIFSNPPVRIGKQNLYALIEEALNHLNETGIFYFVMHKKHGVDSFINHFKTRYQVEILTQSKGFKVGFIRDLY